jgi:hypothetical protein
MGRNVGVSKMLKLKEKVQKRLNKFVSKLSNKDFGLLVDEVEKRRNTIKPGNGTYYKVFVDGKEYEYVYKANKEEGWIEIFQRKYGAFVLSECQTYFKTEIIKGKVELEKI